MRKHAAPIIAAILLLLPVLYVGSYLALVKPPSLSYRIEGAWVSSFFWPPALIDRKLRPRVWEPELTRGGPSSETGTE